MANKILIALVVLISLRGSIIALDTSAIYTAMVHDEWLTISKNEKNVVNDWYPQLRAVINGPIPLSALYEKKPTHLLVEKFVKQTINDAHIANTILYYANRNQVPIALAISIAWSESKFDTRAYYSNRDSVDRGLFQLNSKSFVRLQEDDFFHIDTNTQHAMKYLRYCLDNAAGDYYKAVAIYNAGLGRVIRNQIPESTKGYANKVLNYHASLIQQFRKFIKMHLEPPDQNVGDKKENANYTS